VIDEIMKKNTNRHLSKKATTRFHVYFSPIFTFAVCSTCCVTLGNGKRKVKEKSKKSQRKDSFSVPGYPPIPKRLKNQLAFRMGCK
jgi:hypothetical protein